MNPSIRTALAAVLLWSLCAAIGCDDANARGRGTAMTAGGDPHRGREAIRFHGCSSCHTIPGVSGADGLVGPSLERIASRAYVGGVLSNTPDNLVRWILDPPGIDPRTAMPNLRVPDADARDIAAYLYTLD